MATITLRIPDELRDGLQAKADAERQSLSEFVRDRLQDVVFDFRAPENTGNSTQPESLTSMERHTLSLLHRILARVLPEDANDTDGDTEYQLERARVLEEGFTSEYWVEFAGLHSELTPRQCEFVMDVLDMFSIVIRSVERLEEKGGELEKMTKYVLRFRGFDHNDAVEGHMSSFVQHLVEDGRWEEHREFVLGRERGNSHSQMFEAYSRMLTAYREVKQRRPRSFDPESYLLSKDELEYVAQAHTHPSNR
ncbi:YfbU family protein [Gryllotalpicola daejeonensis]|uniref:YfbU family protein n=1 Tax=Gryllotalpicola daejeonensis TaxID=993087 RepID=A0ABP7ZCU2_9MICO